MAMKDWQWIALLGAGLFIFLFMGGYIGNPTDVTPSDGVSDIVCESSTSPTVTFNMVDKYQNAVTQSGTTFKYRKIGESAWNSVNVGSTVDFAPYDKIEVLADPDFTVGYGSYIASWEVPCKESVSFEATTADKYTSSITGTFWNSQGTAATAQALAAGDVKNVKFQFTGTYRADYGNADIGYNILNCKANSTEIDDLVIVGLEETSKPSLITSTSGFDDYTYKFPIIASNEDTDVYTVSVDADDTVNPTADIVCTLYDTNFDIDADTGAIIKGIQDEDKNNLGLDETSVAAIVTLDFS